MRVGDRIWSLIERSGEEFTIDSLLRYYETDEWGDVSPIARPTPVIEDPRIERLREACDL